MDWADLDLPYLLIRPLTNLQFKEGLYNAAQEVGEV